MVLQLSGADEFLVNHYSSGGQNSVRTSSLGDGRVVATWTTYDSSVSSGGDGDGTSVKFIILDSTGSPVTLETTANARTTADQKFADVAGLSDGRFVITWETEDTTEDGNNSAVMARIFNADGTPVAEEFLVNTEFESSVQGLKVVAHVDGGFAIAWSSGDPDVDGNDAGVAMRVFDAYGDAQNQFTVNTLAIGNQDFPDTLSLSNGNIAVGWRSYDPAVDGDSAGAAFKIVDAAGNTIVSELVLNTKAADQQAVGSIVELEDGRIWVTWSTSDTTADGSDSAIAASILNADGSVDVAEFVVNQEVNSFQFSSQAVVLSDGRVLITWQSQDGGDDSSDYGVKARLFNADGSAASDEMLVNIETAERQSSPAVEVLPDGNVLITWYTEDATQDGSSTAIKGRILEVINQLDGTSGADGLVGESIRDVIDAKGGNDTIFGRKGDDKILAGDGKDQVFGGAGDDEILGGSQNDTLRGNKGDDNIKGESGNDVLRGGRGDDLLDGGENDDVLVGGKGEDNLLGDSGKDTLDGGDDDDVLSGGGGNDKLTGGADDDILTGGDGNDKFVFKPNEGVDEITDFQNGQDKIDLKAFGFKNKAAALAKFAEAGTGSDDQIVFNHKETGIVINGIDMSQLGNSDIII